jgi:hypothetical protein
MSGDASADAISKFKTSLLLKAHVEIRRIIKSRRRWLNRGIYKSIKPGAAGLYD